MERHSLCLKPAILAGALAAWGIPAAFAIEAEDVGERLKAITAKQHIEITYEDARMNGADVTLEAVTVSGPDGDVAVPVGDVTLRDVTEDGDGAYRVDSVAVDDFQYEGRSGTYSFAGFTMRGLVLPADAESDTFDGTMRYDQTGLARVNFEGKDGLLVSAEDINAEITVSDDDTMMLDSAVGSFLFDLRSVEGNANAVNVLKEMGYDQINGRARMEGSWRPSDGRTTVSRYEVTVEDAGTLHLMADFDGYTPDFIQAMDEMSKQSEENAGGGRNNTAQGMAMLGMMQRLTFHGMTLRFTDDSLTGKALDYAAKQQGSKPEDIVAQAKAIIPMQLGPYLGAELTQNLTQAVGTFLENPDNLEISAKPDTPVPFAMLMGAAMGAPEMLVKQIGLTVTANQ
ncbi:hypothetical protein [Chelativorans salis]|uniref:DUF945 domain-containing protein n=1 Tax=Chelativorans salis TaxID=2978478 RepID=A0ABT2LR85_9HYPH|nr:hypothetical protein [Chelativorans sp. EGI FJ00035]MCT7375873.1 hypothetical protein [Chelativorans sp. EGI FJ00035]